MLSAKIDIISSEPLSFQSEETITLYLEITLTNTCGQLVIFMFIDFIFVFIHFPLKMFINFIRKGGKVGILKFGAIYKFITH